MPPSNPAPHPLADRRQRGCDVGRLLLLALPGQLQREDGGRALQAVHHRVPRVAAAWAATAAVRAATAGRVSNGQGTRPCHVAALEVLCAPHPATGGDESKQRVPHPLSHPWTIPLPLSPPGRRASPSSVSHDLSVSASISRSRSPSFCPAAATPAARRISRSPVAWRRAVGGSRAVVMAPVSEQGVHACWTSESAAPLCHTCVIDAPPLTPSCAQCSSCTSSS